MDFEVAHVYLRNLILCTLFYAPFCPAVMLLGAFGAFAHYYVLKNKMVSKSRMPEPLQTAIPMFMANNMVNIVVGLAASVFVAMGFLNLNA